MELEKYSMGVGDRFGHQAKAQLSAIAAAKELGVDIVPVWNKSHREHTTIGTAPGDVRREADAAVAALGWEDSHYVDADHIGLKNVDLFIDASDFFTLDVADFTGESADADSIAAFVSKYSAYAGTLTIPGIEEPFDVSQDQIEAIAAKYLLAVQEAGKIYRHIESAKAAENFVAEVSMDETDDPQTPVELFFILAMIADEGIPVQTIAPKFSGRFNKGVEYVGDPQAFAREFRDDVLVIAEAVEKFGLPDNLKLSVHSGSDKFAIYRKIGAIIRDYDAGLHLKTAGTTWLEELIGLALAGGEGLVIAKDVYRISLDRFGELCGPYATVIDIDPLELPSADEVDEWTGEQYAGALCHDQSCALYNPNFRQMLHVAYKVAAEMGDRYIGALEEFEETIAQNVSSNILEKHIKPLFVR